MPIKPILYCDFGNSMVILARKIQYSYASSWVGFAELVEKYGKKSPYRGIVIMYPISEWKILHAN